MSLAFRDVACVRGAKLLFSGVSFDLGPGDAAILTGPNGIGKSSLIRIAAGLLAPFEGVVTCDADKALLTEASALDTERTLVAALRFWASLDRTPNPRTPNPRTPDPDTPDAATRVARALAALDLDDLAEVPVRLLSTGQRRRASIARVVASEAPVWLLDEPGNGLDTASVARLEAAIARHRGGGGIVLAATHLPLSMPGARQIAL